MNAAKWMGFAVVLVVVGLAAFWPLSAEKPEERFRSLVCDPIPASVRNIHVTGATGLAGSNQTIRFEVSPEDFDVILRHRNFQLVSGKPLYVERRAECPICYQAKVAESAVFTIFTDEKRSIVYFNYVKM